MATNEKRTKDPKKKVKEKKKEPGQIYRTYEKKRGKKKIIIK